MNYRLVSLLILIMPISAFSSPVNVNQITVLRSHKVPGNQLCQDGNSIYYKSLKACKDYGNQDCQSLKISSIYNHEIIQSDHGLIDRLFGIKLIYGERRDGKLVYRKIPYCKNLPKRSPKIRKEVRSSLPEENTFFSNLIKQGINTIFAPKGVYDKINEFKYILHFPEQDFPKNNEYQPRCFDDSNFDLVIKAGGELSGGGIIKNVYQQLRNNSCDIVPTAIVDGAGEHKSYSCICVQDL